jgi:hypothetical protein
VSSGLRVFPANIFISDVRDIGINSRHTNKTSPFILRDDYALRWIAGNNVVARIELAFGQCLHNFRQICDDLSWGDHSTTLISRCARLSWQNGIPPGARRGGHDRSDDDDNNDDDEDTVYERTVAQQTKLCLTLL